MNAAMEINVLVLLTIIFFASQVFEARYTWPRLPQLPRRCNSTSDCDEGQCCRRNNSDIIEFNDMLDLLTGTGTCSDRLSGPGQLCNGCGCVEGYECYRTITGVCCPPYTCWRREDAQRDREFWDNCFKDPKCDLPQSANPGGNVGLNNDVNQQPRV